MALQDRSERFRVTLPVTVREDIIDSPRIAGLVSKDISVGGLAIEIHDADLSAKLLDGRVPGLWIEIQLPDRTRPEMVMARKMWCRDLGDGKSLSGFRFLGFAEEAQLRIHNYLSDLLDREEPQKEG